MFFGDSNFFDPRNADNIRLSREAIQASRADIISAFQGGPIAPLDGSVFLDYGPIVDDADTRTTCPLFRLVNNGGVDVLEQRDTIVRPANWRIDSTIAAPPVDSSVVTCPASPSPLPPCSYKTMTKSDCPGTVELLFAKQSFVDPAKFGARTMCYDDNQRSYVASYGNASLSTGAIVGIAVGCAVFVGMTSTDVCVCVCAQNLRNHMIF